MMMMMVTVIDRSIGDSGRVLRPASSYIRSMTIAEAARLLDVPADDLVYGIEQRGKYITKKFWVVRDA